MKIRTGIREVNLAVRIPAMTLFFPIKRSFTYKDALYGREYMTACEYGQMAVWLHGRIIVEMYECMYGKCVPALELELVADGVWVCMSVGMALN